MRCQSCNKFVSFDTDAEPEEESQDVDGTNFTATYRRVLQCSECGDDLKEATLELEYDFGDDVKTDKATDEKEAPATETEDKEEATEPETHEHEFEIESCAAEATTGSVSRRVTYGVKLSVEVECSVEGCKAHATFECEESEQASSFEEL